MLYVHFQDVPPVGLEQDALPKQAQDMQKLKKTNTAETREPTLCSQTSLQTYTHACPRKEDACLCEASLSQKCNLDQAIACKPCGILQAGLVIIASQEGRPTDEPSAGSAALRDALLPVYQ